MHDHLIRITTGDGSLRAVAAVATALVEEVRRRQQTDPTATVALGRLICGTALMGALLKQEQRLALTIEGSGPLQRLQAETDAEGHVRGSVKVPVCGLPPKEDSFDVAGAIGRAGFLHVIKDLGLREPYRSMVQLYKSTVAEDLAYYLTASEQVPSTVALGVYLQADGRVGAAGGFMVQALPGGDPTLIPLLEERLLALPPVTVMLRNGESPLQILDHLLQGIPYQIKSEIPLEFCCSCSRRQALQIALTLSREERQALFAEAGEIRITCEFCKESYALSKREVPA